MKHVLTSKRIKKTGQEMRLRKCLICKHIFYSVAFPKKNEKKNSGRSVFFFSEKNIKDRLNAILRFVLSLGNMSKVL